MVKECSADQCEYNQEGLCAIECYYKDIKPCKIEVSNTDLIECCIGCELPVEECKCGGELK